MDPQGLRERSPTPQLRMVRGNMETVKPVFPILGVFRLNGQPKRDDGMIVRSCKARQSPVYPLNASSRTGLVSTKTP